MGSIQIDIIQLVLVLGSLIVWLAGLQYDRNRTKKDVTEMKHQQENTIKGLRSDFLAMISEVKRDHDNFSRDLRNELHVMAASIQGMGVQLGRIEGKLSIEK
jgi:hypothetical protein